MIIKNTLLFIAVFCFSLIQHSDRITTTNSISKIEMNLSAFGVESDDFPSIQVFINVKTGSSKCKKTYYSSKHKDSIYSLSKSDINSIKRLLKYSDLKQLKSKYSVNKSDQPISTTKIYTSLKNFVIEDYGLSGEYPLQELYKIVYKF